MAILEAACCNLLVVSTNVGGVPEVLPDRMVYLAQPSSEELQDKLIQAIKDVPYVDTTDFYDELKTIYSWDEVANKTVKVYDSVMNLPFPTIMSRIKNALSTGNLVWILTYWYLHLEYFALFLLEIFWPVDEIDILPDFDSVRYKEEGILNYGNHNFNVKEGMNPEFKLIDPLCKN